MAAWYYASEGESMGPVEDAVFQQLVVDGQIGPETMVWKEGMADWQTYGSLSVGVAVPPDLPYPLPSAGRVTRDYGVQPGQGQGSPSICGLAIVSLALGVVGVVFCGLGVVLGVPAVVCGHLALARIKRSQGALGGRGLALWGLITGYASVLFMVVLVAFILLPMVSMEYGHVRQVSCTTNLKQIGLGVLMYAEDNRGAFPRDLLSLQPYIGDLGILRCPGRPATEDVRVDYDYFGAGLSLDQIERPAETVVAADQAGNHDDVITVLFADGHVESVSNIDGLPIEGIAAAKGWTLGEAPEP